MDRHKQREEAVFAEFASICPLRIDLASIEKREPPQPDIFCIAEKGPVAFEMVELVDRDQIARPEANQLELMDCMRQARDNLHKEIRSAFDNALVGVRFRPQSIRKRNAVAEQIVKELTRIDSDFSGEFTLMEGNSEVATANVRRRDGIVDGPHFRVLVAGHYDPIPRDALEEKFRKKYQSDAPINLLAYYDRQHAPLDEQIDELIQFINAKIANSSFRSVWIFNLFDRRICYPKA